MINSNRRIFLAIFLSLVIFFAIRYVSLNPAQFNPSNIYAGITQKTAEIRTKIASIKFSEFSKIFTLNFNPVSNQPLQQYNNSRNNFALPTVLQNISPTYKIGNGLIPTSKPYIKPTTRPIPTYRPQPTKVPEPTTIPIGNVRPGSSIQEIADMVQKYTCTPANLIKAVKYWETGESFLNADAATIRKYNTYDWWNNASSAQEICSGYAYNVIKGTIPSDSKFAGTRCQNPLGKQDYPYAIMGILPLDDSEQIAYIDDFQRVFNTNLPVDRRVFFDAMMMVGFHLKNISLERSDNCAQWDVKYIFKAACKYQGGCIFQYTTGSDRSGDYCYLTCTKYNEYAGTSYDCTSAGNYLDASCNFK